MDTIFHEKQEGSLCAQHCLNSLLQGSYYTPVDLSLLAQTMDEAERLRMAENGIESEEYQRFIQQPSGNMDDSGYFSVQVISSALQVWGLELVPYSSTDERIAHVFDNPCQMQAFICNYRDHWFTIRKLGYEWFNLNSLLKQPELISDTYLSLFLAQLKNDGYSIFVVLGDLPECRADKMLRMKPVRHSKQNEDAQLAEALKMSLQDEKVKDDENLESTLKLSLETTRTSRDSESDNEEDLLQKAIDMSLQC